jgi:hypothetical protein
MAVFIGVLFWPSDPQTSPYDLSRADRKPRFYATTYSKMEAPPNLTLPQRLSWKWRQYRQHHAKRTPSAYIIAAPPVVPYTIQELLDSCMELTGTQYLIAVEIAGGVEFGTTNSLNGAQWVTAIEHAIETSKPVVCYDYTKKRNFQDTLLLVRDRPGVVKVVPRTKLTEYQNAGLIKAKR